MIPHAAFIVYLLGALFALIVGATLDVYKFIFGYTIVFTSVFSAVYINNYNDVGIDKYSTSTLFSGGSRILIEHPELRRLAKWMAVSLFSLSILLAFLFIIAYSYPVTFLVFVIIGNLFAWFYTSPPIKLVYRGFGELTTMIGAGFLIPGFAYFVVMGQINFSFFLFSIPFLLYGFALALNFEIPDVDVDHQGNKKTLIVRKGTHIGLTLNVVLSFCATLSFLLLAQLNVTAADINFWLIAFLSLLPLSFCVYSLIKHNIDRTTLRKLVTRNAVTIFSVLILIDVYFLFLIFI